MNLISELNQAILTALAAENPFMGAKKSISTTTGKESYRDFIVVPMGTDKDGNPQYASVSLSMMKSKPTEKMAAFDPDEAVAMFEEHCQAISEKAARPKAVKKNDETAARKAARLEAVRDWVAVNEALNREVTSTDVWKELDETLFPTVMLVGSCLAELTGTGELTCQVREGKKYYRIA